MGATTNAKHGSIESLTLEGEAGGLEALLNLGSSVARYAALVCHPHPVYGGTMHNKVVYHAMKALNGFGFPVLRFNFRGVGSSAGEYDEGRGEVADARVALDYLSERFALPIVFAGFSFGAAVGLRAAAADSRVEGLVLLGAPVNAQGREYSYESLENNPRLKLMVSGDHDQFATPAQLREIFARAAEPKRLVVIPRADHFFTGHLDEMRDAIKSWVGELAGTSAV